MSPSDIQPGSPEANPPQFYPVQFHPEFGYFAPAMPFRRKASLVGKGLAAGLVIGALAVILWPDQDGSRVRPFFTLHAQAVAGDGLAATQVRFVAPTLALPAAARAASTKIAARPAAMELASPVAVAPPHAAPALAIARPEAAAAVAEPAEQKAPARPKRKFARKPRQDRDARPVEIDARRYAEPRGNARYYAEPRGNSRYYAEPRSQRGYSPFGGFGW